MDLRKLAFSLVFVSLCYLFTPVLTDHLQTRSRSHIVRSRKIPSLVDHVGRPLSGRTGRQVFYMLPNTARRPWSTRRLSPWVMPRRFQQMVADRIRALRNQGKSHSENSIVLQPSPQPTPVITRFPVRKINAGLPKPTVIATKPELNNVMQDKVMAVPVPVIIKGNGKVKPAATQNKPLIPVTSNMEPVKENGTQNKKPVVAIHNGPEPALKVKEDNGDVVQTKTEHARVDMPINRELTSQNKPVFTDTSNGQTDSLLHLLNDRQPVIKDKNEEAKLKQHLMTLSEIQKSNGLSATNQRLIRMQLEYIDTIQESRIKREVLKLFVKDIVEKSGFLIKSEHTSADIKEMTSLLELINSISSKRASSTTTPMPVTEKQQSESLRSRIGAGLDMHRYQHSEKSPEQLPGINLDHLVGLSIYGDRQPADKTDKPTDTAKSPVKTTQPPTKFSPNFEPIGGTDEYWTHLSAGFQDMLCALCQQRNHEACITRYCQNGE